MNDKRFADLYERYFGHVYGYCRRRVSSDRVDDAVADTFLTVWRRIEDVPAGDDALLWIYRVAYRVVGHVWRGAKRHQRLESRLSSIGMTPHPAAEEFVVRSEEERRAISAASRLSSRDEEVLRLSVWEQLSHAHIAAILGISKGAVKQRLHRAKKNLTREYNRLERKTERSPHAAQEGGAW